MYRDQIQRVGVWLTDRDLASASLSCRTFNDSLSNLLNQRKQNQELRSQYKARDIIFSPDGQFLTMLCTQSLSLWYVCDMALYHFMELPFAVDYQVPMRYLSDTLLLIATNENNFEFMIWSLERQSVIKICSMSMPFVRFEHIFNSPFLFSLSKFCITIWDANTGSHRKELTSSQLLEHSAISKRHLLAVSSKEDLFLISVNMDESVTQMVKHNTNINALCFSDDGCMLVSSSNTESVVWDVEKRKVMPLLEIKIIFTVITPMNDTFLCANPDEIVKFNHKQLNGFMLANGLVEMKLSRDHRYMFYVSYFYKIYVYELSTISLILEIDINQIRTDYDTADFSPDSTLLIVRKFIFMEPNYNYEIWDIESRTLLYQIK